jgi:cell wall-associated NlpC family hydrolase
MDYAQYVGLPYRLGGRDRDGIDCWGLVRLVLQEQFNVEIPSLAYEAEPRIEVFDQLSDETRETYKMLQVETPIVGDVALLRVGGHITHVGIIVAPGILLHTMDEVDSVVERIDTHRIARRIEGYYRVC